MEATLCHCGRHKDRCRCAGRLEAFAEAAAWCREKERVFEGNYTADGLQFAAEHFEALANGAP